MTVVLLLPMLRCAYMQVNVAGLSGGVQGEEGVRGSAVCSNTSPYWIDREVVPAANQDFPKGRSETYGCWAHRMDWE